MKITVRYKGYVYRLKDILATRGEFFGVLYCPTLKVIVAPLKDVQIIRIVDD